MRHTLRSLTVLVAGVLALSGCTSSVPQRADHVETSPLSPSGVVRVPAQATFTLDTPQVQAVPPAPTPSVTTAPREHTRVASPPATPVTAASVGTPAADVPAGPGPTLTVYMAPDGTDANDGLTPTTAVATFFAAERVARNNGGLTANVDVRLTGGQYRTSPSTWKLAPAGMRVRFIPAGYVDGTVPSDGDRPTFVGDDLGGTYWLDVTPPPGSTARFDVRYVNVTGYSNGLRITGGYVYDQGPDVAAHGAGTPLPGAVVTANTFTRIGSAYSAKTGYAAVHLQNTTGALVAGNVFDHVENTGAGGSLLHGVYVVGADDVHVTGNVFSTISGDAVRTRHRTSGVITGNSMTAAGSYAAVSDWFCDHACAQKNTQSYECPAGTLDVRDNTVVSGYDGRNLPQWAATISASGADPRC